MSTKLKCEEELQNSKRRNTTMGIYDICGNVSALTDFAKMHSKAGMDVLFLFGIFNREKINRFISFLKKYPTDSMFLKNGRRYTAKVEGDESPHCGTCEDKDTNERLQNENDSFKILNCTSFNCTLNVGRGEILIVLVIFFAFRAIKIFDDLESKGSAFMNILSCWIHTGGRIDEIVQNDEPCDDLMTPAVSRNDALRYMYLRGEAYLPAYQNGGKVCRGTGMTQRYQEKNIAMKKDSEQARHEYTMNIQLTTFDMNYVIQESHREVTTHPCAAVYRLLCNAIFGKIRYVVGNVVAKEYGFTTTLSFEGQQPSAGELMTDTNAKITSDCGPPEGTPARRTSRVVLNQIPRPRSKTESLSEQLGESDGQPEEQSHVEEKQEVEISAAIREASVIQGDGTSDVSSRSIREARVIQGDGTSDVSSGSIPDASVIQGDGTSDVSSRSIPDASVIQGDGTSDVSSRSIPEERDIQGDGTSDVSSRSIPEARDIQGNGTSDVSSRSIPEASVIQEIGHNDTFGRVTDDLQPPVIADRSPALPQHNDADRGRWSSCDQDTATRDVPGHPLETEGRSRHGDKNDGPRDSASVAVPAKQGGKDEDTSSSGSDHSIQPATKNQLLAVEEGDEEKEGSQTAPDQGTSAHKTSCERDVVSLRTGKKEVAEGSAQETELDDTTSRGDDHGSQSAIQKRSLSLKEADEELEEGTTQSDQKPKVDNDLFSDFVSLRAEKKEDTQGFPLIRLVILPREPEDRDTSAATGNTTSPIDIAERSRPLEQGSGGGGGKSTDKDLERSVDDVPQCQRGGEMVSLHIEKKEDTGKSAHDRGMSSREERKTGSIPTTTTSDITPSVSSEGSLAMRDGSEESAGTSTSSDEASGAVLTIMVYVEPQSKEDILVELVRWRILVPQSLTCLPLMPRDVSPRLSFGERMRIESLRLASFYGYSGENSCVQFARDGFFRTSGSGTLTCYSCGFSLGEDSLGPGVDVSALHREGSPGCLHVENRDARNVPIQDEALPSVRDLKQMVRESLAQLQGTVQVYYVTIQNIAVAESILSNDTKTANGPSLPFGSNHSADSRRRSRDSITRPSNAITNGGEPSSHSRSSHHMDDYSAISFASSRPTTNAGGLTLTVGQAAAPGNERGDLASSSAYVSPPTHASASVLTIGGGEGGNGELTPTQHQPRVHDQHSGDHDSQLSSSFRRDLPQLPPTQQSFLNGDATGGALYQEGQVRSQASAPVVNGISPRETLTPENSSWLPVNVMHGTEYQQGNGRMSLAAQDQVARRSDVRESVPPDQQLQRSFEIQTTPTVRQSREATPPDAASHAPSETDYDPSRAVHSQYTELQQREESFAHWPDTHAQSPQELAIAGFFYVGHGDCVRCHYCGLGLKHWDPDDKSLDEHVRWRSSCAYLRALIGDDVITRVLAQIGRRREGSPGRSSENSQSVTAALTSPGVVSNGNTHHVTASEGNGNTEAFLTSPVVAPAREMGFSDDIIRQGIDALLATRAGRRAVTSQNLVHAILFVRERGQNPDSPPASIVNISFGDDDPSDEGNEGASNSGTIVHRGTAANGIPDASGRPTPLPTGNTTEVLVFTAHGAGRQNEAAAESSGPGRLAGGTGHPAPERPAPAQRRSVGSGATTTETIRRLEEENHELRERRRCKICLDNDISILFLPCGHLVCCSECAPALRRCPMCRKRITGSVCTQFAAVPEGGVAK